MSSVERSRRRLGRTLSGPIHLLLTDVVMPEMDGEELVEQIQSWRPGVRALYMSGYSGSAVLRQATGVPFLPKPFSQEALLQSIQAVLDSEV